MPSKPVDRPFPQTTGGLHPDGTFNATADVQFVGTVAGRPGTLHQHFESIGDGAAFHGQLETLSGTGDLASFHGEGTFQGSSLTFAGTYRLSYHFD